MISAEDVQEVLQFTAFARAEPAGPGSTRCGWWTQDGRASRLNVEFSDDEPLVEADAWLERARRGGVEPLRIEGLGDAVFWIAGDLQVWAGGRKLRLSRPLANDPALSRLLAERALERLLP